EPDVVERAAYLLATSGDARRGVDLLASLDVRAAMQRDGTLLLARLVARTGDLERARTLCGRLLGRPDVEIVQLAPTLEVALGRTADADAALALLDAATSRPGDRELVRARVAVATGRNDEAAEAYKQAVERDPRRADVWTERVEFAIHRGDAATIAAA